MNSIYTKILTEPYIGHEQGYFGYFNLSQDFISFQISNLFLELYIISRFAVIFGIYLLALLFVFLKADSKNLIRDRLVRICFFVLIFIMACFLFNFTLGEFKAKYKRVFLIYDSNPEMVVLRAHSNRFICAEFDRENKTVDSTIVIIDISSDSPIKLHEEKIGPLKPIKKFLEENKSE